MIEIKHVIVTGATGLVGRRVIGILLERGIAVSAFVRDTQKARLVLGDKVNLIAWDAIDPAISGWQTSIAGHDAIIHLAGTPIFARRWTKRLKQEIADSRIASASRLVSAIQSAARRPAVFISASAIGYYGTALDHDGSETAAPAHDFLADICVRWEAAALPLEQLGVRRVAVRTGIVLSDSGGMLGKALPLFRWGLGGVIGQNKLWLNWIHLDDLAQIYVKSLLDPAISGPINAVTPNPLSNGDFYHALAQSLRRPCFLHYPAWLLRFGIGAGARYISGGPHLSCQKLVDTGYAFRHATLPEALANLLPPPRAKK